MKVVRKKVRRPTSKSPFVEADPSDIWAGYDPVSVLVALQELRALRLLEGVDKEVLLLDIYDARGQRESSKT